MIGTVSSAEKAEQARSIGADHVINYRDEDVVARVQAITSGAGVDRIVEVALGANLGSSLQVLKINGVIAIYSSDADPTPTIPFGQLLGKDVTIRSMRSSTIDRSAALPPADWHGDEADS